jgi:endonuclease/exonuclease/phosphatase family metal-dependent hydrolase
MSTRVKNLRRSAAVLLSVALLVAGIVGMGSVRRPYGELVSNKMLLPARPKTIAGPSRFRVATFNIHSGRGVDGKENLGRTAQDIVGFDLVGLNEVRGANLLRATDQAAELGRQLGMAVAFGPSERRWFVTSFGNGLLSRLPIIGWRSRPMRVAGESSYRAVILAKIMVGNRDVNVVVAHVERVGARDAQLMELGELFAGIPEPAVLLGDFNAKVTHPGLQRIGGLPGVENALATLERATAGVDHIYAKGLVAKSGEVVPTQASDHPLVWTELEFPSLP